MKRFGRIAAAGMCAVMVMSMLTGCSKVNTGETAAKVGDAVITFGEANFMLRFNQAETQTYLGALFGAVQNMFEQDLTGSGQAYGAVLKSNVMENLKDMVVLEQHMGDYGVEITADDQAAIEAAAQAFLDSNPKDVLEAMTATKESVSRVLTLYTIQSKMAAAIEADVDTEVSDEEAAQKTVQYAYFATPVPETEEETEAAEETTEAASEAAEETTAEETAEAAESETEAAEETTEAAEEDSPEKIALREQLQALIDEVKGGKALADAVNEAEEGKTLTDYSYGEDTTIMNEKLKAAADTLADGEIYAEPVEVENGFYVVQMVSTFDREKTDERKLEIIEERKTELYNTTLEGWEPDSFEINSKVWDPVDYFDTFEVKIPETEAAEETAAAESETEAAEETAAAESETEAAEETTEAAESETEAAEETTEAAESETEAK